MRVIAGKRRTYDAPFREGAVRIVLEKGKPAAEAARDLGVHEGTLQTWVHRAKVRADAEAAGGLDESEREELLRRREESKSLRRENAEIGMERDVLNRSVALWVKACVAASAWCSPWDVWGSALDNAAAESFPSSIKVEYIRRHCFATRAEPG
ncbi:transposase [Streptomyces sp. NPDC018045]|uniref:transposase n=1 Tax=Streptomyces sp. NPDC018045 TaxID=3365037 RepID=UPI0037B6F6FB